MNLGQDLRRLHIFRLAELEALESAVSIGWRNYYAIVNDQRWAETLQEPEFVSLLSWVKADLDRQRAKVEAEDAKEDFRAIVERVLSAESEG